MKWFRLNPIKLNNAKQLKTKDKKNNLNKKGQMIMSKMEIALMINVFCNNLTRVNLNKILIKLVKKKMI